MVMSLLSYVASRPGELITTAQAAEATGMTEEAAEQALRELSVSDEMWTWLSRRQGGWVFSPVPEGGEPRADH